MKLKELIEKLQAAAATLTPETTEVAICQHEDLETLESLDTFMPALTNVQYVGISGEETVVLVSTLVGKNRGG